MEPGRILTVKAIKHMYREDLVGIDYLRGDEPYKRRMAATAKRILNVRVAAPTWWPRLRHVAWWTGFEVKQWMRRRTGRTPVVVVDLAAGGSLIPQSI
jgi:CelD/BcsL family acetyltransferase involved in cellulose biosynthesis